jgi:hypothetical protein
MNVIQPPHCYDRKTSTDISIPPRKIIRDSRNTRSFANSTSALPVYDIYYSLLIIIRSWIVSSFIWVLTDL